MVERLARGWQHTTVLLAALLSKPQRRLLQQMLYFGRTLPAQFEQPLPQMMAQLTPRPHLAQPDPPVPPPRVRQLADAVAAWQIRSPLGICLRRSLLRYHFLRRAGLPVIVVFGARFKGSHEGGGIGGHAWLNLNGTPYHENPDDYQGFVVMYTYPPVESGS